MRCMAVFPDLGMNGTGWALFPASTAREPDFTPEKLAFFLLDPRPKMPNFLLSRNEAADLGGLYRLAAEVERSKHGKRLPRVNSNGLMK